MGNPYGMSLDWSEILIFVLGLYFLSSGSLVFNQAQEWRLDKKMSRTQSRPIPSGKIQPWQAYVLGSVFCFTGLLFLAYFGSLTFYLGIFTVILYNVLYTLYWKKKWTFGAVPGALPGALPVSIGFSCQNQNLLDPLHIYLFLILFLWQMPHFWTLAIRFKEDYAQANIPVLPYIMGVNKTLYHIGLYTFVYVSVAMTAPITIRAGGVHFLIAGPFVVMVLWQFFKFMKRKEKAWLSFFLTVNFSLLAFLIAPLIDRWTMFYL